MSKEKKVEQTTVHEECARFIKPEVQPKIGDSFMCEQDRLAIINDLSNLPYNKVAGAIEFLSTLPKAK